MGDTRITDEQLAKLESVHAGVEYGAWPEYEYVGRPYMQEQTLTKASLDFYVHAHSAVPQLIAEVRDLRAELAKRDSANG